MKKRLFISGGQGGLALSVISFFSDQGWEVDAPSRQVLDVSDCRGVESWFDDHDPYDCVVCNAAITLDKPYRNLSHEDWDSVMDVNLKGVAWCARCAASKMKKAHYGNIVLIGSYAGSRPQPGQTAYATSKAALDGLMKTLAREWGSSKIRVNLVLPGFMQTSMTNNLSTSIQKKILEKHLLGQFNTPGNVAGFIYFLHEFLPATSGQIFSLDSRILNH